VNTLNTNVTDLQNQVAGLGTGGGTSGGGNTGTGAHSVATGDGSAASQSGTVAVGHNAQATYSGAVAIGEGAQATADPATAVGNNAVASGNNSVALGATATASGNTAVALGVNSKATAANSVALGAGSVADEANTVSVGSATQQRRITNVAAGTNDTDAVNVGQFNAGLANTLSQANAYTDSRISGLRKSLNARADGGAAAAMAINGIPQSVSQGLTIGIGFGGWRGASGVAIGGSDMLADGHTTVKAGATFDTNGGNGFSAGIGYHF
jgi:autotransporter adhesin